MCIDDVKVAWAQQPKPLENAAWQESQHRGKVCDRQLSSEENRRAHHADTVLDVQACKTERLGGEYGDLVPTRQFPGERSHHHPAAAAERRGLIVAEKDLQGAKLFKRARLFAF